MPIPSNRTSTREDANELESLWKELAAELTTEREDEEAATIQKDDPTKNPAPAPPTKPSSMSSSSWWSDANKELRQPVPFEKMTPVVAIGLGVFVLIHTVPLLSLPSVVRGRGAPYLPTFQNNMDKMFRLLRQEPSVQRRVQAGERLRFVDLGSGDGRLVFQAARENMFSVSVGYEINPLLHLVATLRKLLHGPAYWNSTAFYLQDIWKTDLRSTHVVAVYGLSPIMKELGHKLQKELPNESVVLSNVFVFPGWKHTSHDDGIYVYKTPDCWK